MGVAVPFSVLGFYGRGADEGSARGAWDGGDAMQYPDRRDGQWCWQRTAGVGGSTD